jgi:hypothetical protein
MCSLRISVGTWLPWLRYFTVFLSSLPPPPRQMPGFILIRSQPLPSESFLIHHPSSYQSTLCSLATGCVISHHHHWQTSPFWATAFLREFCQITSGFHFFGFRNGNSFFLQSKVVSPASNPQPGGPGPCIYVPQWQSDSAIPSGTGFPFQHLLQFTGLRGSNSYTGKSQRLIRTPTYIWRLFEISVWVERFEVLTRQ